MKARSSLTTTLIAFLAVCMSMACNQKASNNGNGSTNPDDTKVEQDLIAGEYCYELKEIALTLTGTMDYDGKSKVSGTLYGENHDAVENYFVTYITTFEGKRDGKNLKVKTKTEIEGDVQFGDALWPWTGDHLTEGLHEMKQVDCEPSPE